MLMSRMVFSAVRGRGEQRVSAIKTCIGWFALGAFVSSTIHEVFMGLEPSTLVTVAGGIVAAAISSAFKLV